MQERPRRLSARTVPSTAVTRRAVVRIDGAGLRPSAVDAVAVEEPLDVRVDEETLAVTMRTPGADRQLALGFLFSEGVIGSPADVASVERVEGEANAIDVLLREPAQATRVLQSRRWSIHSACGVCGRRSIADLLERCGPVPAGSPFPSGRIADCFERMRARQEGFQHTGGLHAAALFDLHGTVLALEEDVGRHNAVDKAVGRLLERDAIGPRAHSGAPRPLLLAVSGRASFEIVQKAAMAAIPYVASVSAASSLAIDLADALGITLIGFAREGRLSVYSHPEQLLELPSGLPAQPAAGRPSEHPR